MQQITSTSGLREAIILLENKRKNEETALREQMHQAYESIRPINLIKSTYEDVVASQDLKDSLVNTSVGLTVGYVSKALFEGVSHGPLRKLLGTVLLFGVTNAVRKNPETVKAIMTKIFSVLRTMTQHRNSSIKLHSAMERNSAE